MGHFKSIINVNGNPYETLADILPYPIKNLDILFIAKTPATTSVEIGHYFQGKHGKMFWNKLINHQLLTIKSGTYEDENFASHNYGITDIVKVPRNYGNEPSQDEYRHGLERILQTINSYKPKVLVFVYKTVLDNILKLEFNNSTKSVYGFNQNLESYFNSKVFVFPMPGTPCKKDQAKISMTELQNFIKN